jgi:hypothetical protein
VCSDCLLQRHPPFRVGRSNDDVIKRKSRSPYSVPADSAMASNIASSIPFKNVLGVLPGDLPFAVRVIKKALQRFARPLPCTRKSLHVIEIKAKKPSPRLAEIIESRIA